MVFCFDAIIEKLKLSDIHINQVVESAVSDLKSKLKASVSCLLPGLLWFAVICLDFIACLLLIPVVSSVVSTT